MTKRSIATSFPTDHDFLSAAKEALSAFSISADQITPESRSENVTFRVIGTNSDSFVLRIHRPTYHNFDELVSEQIWTESLLHEGIDVPVALKTQSGDRYVEVNVAGESRYAGLLKWVDGELLSRSRTSKSIARTYALLGGLMAQLHNQATRWVVPPGFSRHRLDADGFVGENPFWGRFWEVEDLSTDQRLDLANKRNVMAEVLASYENSTDAFSLIHADLHPANVVINGPRLHIIDFDDSGFGWHAYDLAVAIMDMRGSKDFEQAWFALLQGYRELRDISSRDVSMIEVFFLVRSMASIGWISLRPDLNRDTRSIVQSLYSDIEANFDQVISVTT